MRDQILYEYKHPSGQKITLMHGDLVAQEVDAIVNAANERLRHGGGVAAIIVQRGGSVINQESRDWLREHGLVTHKEPAYTSGGDLACKYIIHAVGPVWGSGNEDEKLTDSIEGSLALADKLSLSSIAFSAISTGIFGFPKKRAATIFYNTFQTYFSSHPESGLEDVRMVVFDRPTTEDFAKVWQEVFGA